MLFNASTLLAKIALAAMLGSGALAAPWPQSAKHSTHSIRSLQSGVKLESYHPESKFEVRHKQSSNILHHILTYLHTRPSALAVWTTRSASVRM
jgi:hypothetical protein